MKKASSTFIILCISLITLAQSDGDLEKKFYIRFGYSIPTKAYFGTDPGDYDIWDDITRRGTTFEIGQFFMLNSIPIADGLRLGINADYAEFSLQSLNLNDYDETLLFLKIAAKVGPSLSYSPVEDLVFDVFVKVQLPILGVMFEVGDYGGDQVYLAAGGLGIATGFNVRWRFLMAGFEFNSAKMKFENIDDPGDYLGSISRSGNKTSLPTMNFTFGFNF